MTRGRGVADPQSFDRFAAAYDRFVGLLPGRNTAWVAGLGTSGERALDVGCGSGHAVEVLAPSYGEVLGVDLSRPLIDIARAKRARANVRYEVTDMFEVSDPAGFDLVYSHTMLHHIPDYRGALLHLKGLVRPGGTVALVDNVCDWCPTPPRFVYTRPAKREFLREVRRLGPRDAFFQLRFWHSRPWLDHLLSDRYLTRAAFRDLYGEVFPGCRFDDLGFALAMSWRAPE